MYKILIVEDDLGIAKAVEERIGGFPECSGRVCGI